MSGLPVSGPGDQGRERSVRDAHAGYHDETRTHRDPDVLVDDVVTWRMLSPHLMRALLFLVAPTVLLLVWLLLDYLATTSTPTAVGGLVMTVLAVVVVALYVAGVAAFFAPAKEPIAEFSRLLEGRAGAARGAYEWVDRAARARRTPAEVVPRTVAGVPVLVFRQRSERAMLLVQPYGADLYVGWTMWRSRSSATLLAHFLRDTFGRFAPLPVFSAELRAASTRAMRECVHSLAREGVAAAAHADAAATGPGVDLDRSAPADRDDDQLVGIRDDDRSAGPRRHDRRPDDRRPDDEARRPDALPAAAPVDDPVAGWTGPRERERVAPRRATAEGGWGPPPRD